MNEKEKFYSIRDYGTRLTPGEEMKIERNIYYKNPPAELSHLTTMSKEKIQAMRDKSAAAEQAVFEKVQESAKEWDSQAAQTQQLDMALQYLEIRPTEHTSNEWVADKSSRYEDSEISNMVYKMYYHVYENTKLNRELQKYVPSSWDVTWSIRTNEPRKYHYSSGGGTKIAGQDRKPFKNKADMQKYLDGRIKAYAHLFTEISPPIPKEYVKCFQMHDQLLPGYIVEGKQPNRAAEIMEQKASIRKALAEFSQQSAETQATTPAKSNPTHDEGR